MSGMVTGVTSGDCLGLVLLLIDFPSGTFNTTPPDTSITSGPSGTIPINTASFTWTGTSPTTPTANLTYAFRLAPLEPNFSAFGPATSKTYSGLAKGSYTFFVKARDPGNQEDPSPAQAGFTVDQNGSMITGTAGSVQVTFQGVSVPVGPGALIGQGVKVKTGANGQVQGRCDDGSNFSLALNSSFFLDDSLCRPAGSGVVDLTQGTFRLVGVGLAVNGVGTNAQTQLSGVRTPVSTTFIPGTNADFTTTYTEAGGQGTATTVVTGGTVAVTNSQTGAVTMVPAGQQIAVTGPVPILVAAVLPSSRSVQVGVPATVFATIINAGPIRAIACEPSLLTNVPVTFTFQPTNPATNQPTGATTTPISIAGSAFQSFVVAFTPTAAIPPTELQLSFACGQTQAPITPGVNTVLLSAAPTPIPDIVALAATLGNDGIVNIPGLTGTGFFTVASVNVGAASTITATADMGSVPPLAAISLCQTNAASVCLAAPAGSVTLPIAAGATPTFAIFVTGTGAPVPFLPGQNRIFVRFKDADGNTRGSTSVAVRTQ